ncbi:hypothetical protein D1872_342820 [compost metagenome]
MLFFYFFLLVAPLLRDQPLDRLSGQQIAMVIEFVVAVAFDLDVLHLMNPHEPP